MRFYDSTGSERITIHTDGIQVGKSSEAHQFISSDNTIFYDGDGSTQRLNINNDGMVLNILK